MKIRILRLALGAALLLPLAAPAQTRHAKVKITVPANGATVSGPVKVVLVATGVEIVPATVERSEERGVGKECRSRWSPYH